MKTLIMGIDNVNESNHALINSTVFVKYDDQKQPIYLKDAGGLAKTENTIGDVIIYQTIKGKVKKMRLSSFFIISIVDKINELKSEITEPDYPDC